MKSDKTNYLQKNNAIIKIKLKKSKKDTRVTPLTSFRTFLKTLSKLNNHFFNNQLWSHVLFSRWADVWRYF